MYMGQYNAIKCQSKFHLTRDVFKTNLARQKRLARQHHNRTKTKQNWILFYKVNIKGPFRDPQPYHSFFAKKVEIFTSAEVFNYMFVYKIFLANLFVWWNNCRIVYLLCRHNEYHALWPMQQYDTVQHAWLTNAPQNWLGI